MSWSKSLLRRALARFLPVAVVVAVVTGPASAGSVSSALSGTTESGLSGYRWDPCQPIGYRVSEQGGYDGSVLDIRRAFARIGRATGITFVYEGPTTQVAFVTGRDPSTDITVSWADPARVPKLGGTVAGLSKTQYADHDGVLENVVGQIVFDSTQQLRRGFTRSGPPTWGQAFLHEVGHVVGLSHVSRRTEVMYPTIGRYNHRLGAGDRRRLYLLGTASGCVPESRRLGSGAGGVG